MLDDIYLQVLDMTRTGSIVILIVILVRFLLKKAPKVFSYALWAVVLFRLLCPVSFEAEISIVPEVTPVSQTYSLKDEPISILGAGEAAYQAVGDAINGGLGVQHIRTTEQEADGTARIVTTDWWEVWILVGQYVWITGVACMLLYGIVPYWKLRKRLKIVIPLRGNIFIADDISSPFVVGFFRPKIYLPCNLSEREREYIILHEEHHISRMDHIIKALAFLALCLHWFNPLVWVAFTLAGRDMEMSCDEAVIRQIGPNIRADYSASLLSLATGRRIIAGTPLAFGEGDTRGRIRNLVGWKKPAIWVITAAVIVCVVLGICLLANPMANDPTAGVAYFYGTVTDAAMSVVNEGDREGRAYITLVCDDGSEMLFWCTEDCEVPEDILGKYVMVRGKTEESTGLLVTSRVTITDRTTSGTLENAIDSAILEWNWSKHYEDTFQCASFTELAREEGAGDTVTVYGLALCQFYSAADGALAEEGGSHIPVALTFHIADSGDYVLMEYWQPRDGSFYDDDIKAKFPLLVWPDTQTYILEQMQSCYVQAVEHFRLDTDGVISGLLDQICGDGEVYDSTESIRLNYALEFRELQYYGRYTLQYCFSEFLRGGQTDARGRVMALVCQEIMDEWGEGFVSANADPQVWFNGFLQQAESMKAKHTDAELQAQYPASWILLKMRGLVPSMPDWGITLTVENANPTGVTIVCTQYGGHPTGMLFTGSWFVVEQYRDGQWMAVEPLSDDLAWTTEAWLFPMNETVRWNENWWYLYGELPAGRYRIGKSVSVEDFRITGDSDHAVYYAEFTIAESETGG